MEEEAVRGVDVGIRIGAEEGGVECKQLAKNAVDVL